MSLDLDFSIFKMNTRKHLSMRHKAGALAKP